MTYEEMQELMDKAWKLACEREGFKEVPEWAIQQVSDTQIIIFEELGGDIDAYYEEVA